MVGFLSLYLGICIQISNLDNNIGLDKTTFDST